MRNIWSVSCKRYFETRVLLPIDAALLFLHISQGSDKPLMPRVAD